MALPAGLFSMKPWTISHRITVRMRCLTRRAVSGRVFHVGVYDLEYIGLPYPIDPHIPQDEEGMPLQGVHPRNRVLLVAPPWKVRLVDYPGCFLKCWDGVPAFLNHRIPPVSYDGVIGGC